ncbi:MAG: glycosyl hydrolase 53 family protein [Clostridia bacterium]|nr:glycosyl hydrolase 53 family protein [Clostridia bacterium]
MFKSKAVFLFLCCFLLLCGCSTYQRAEISSDSLYVAEVENLADDFILGMDASCVPALEASGVTFYDFNGEEADVFKTLADSGINYIRVRVWVDPYDSEGNGYGGGNCDIDNAVEIGKRATKYGMKLLVNFHYSDFWADPSKQMTPKAWVGMNIDEKVEALYQYTLESLQKLKKAGVDVGMVQVGNETNGKMCGETIWMNIYKLMDAGSRATREVFPDALVAVHFANPESADSYRSYASKLAYYSLDYDVFASSYYPFWHGTLENLSSLLSEIAETYDKKVMVAETAYAYTDLDSDFSSNTISNESAIIKDYPFTVQGQANSVRNVIDAIANDTTNGIGVFYWEGTWITVGTDSYEQNALLWEQYGSGWASSYAAGYDPDDAGQYYGGCAVDNQAMFAPDGTPLESLKVFDLVRGGNEVELSADAIEDTTLIIDLNGEIALPETVYAVMNDDSKQEIDVVWQNVDYEAMKSGGAQQYDIVGDAGGMEAHCYVSMVEYNFLQNYSFETGDETGWQVSSNGLMDELYVEDKPTDSLTGTYHYHFWSAAANSVEFSLEQEVLELPAGKYKYSISIMGGDAGEQEIYAYVKINGEIVATQAMELTVYNSWDTAVIEGIEYAEGDSIAVGIYVKCSGSGNGAWGKIDDALLNSMT